MTDSESGQSLYLIIEEVERSLVSQQDQRQDIQRKAATMMGFVGAMVTLLLGAQNVIMGMGEVAWRMAMVALGFLILELGMLSWVYWVREYRADPEPLALAKEYLNQPEEETRRQLLANKIDSHETNRKRIERSARFLQIAFALQAASTVLLGVLLLLAFATSQGA